MPVNIDSPPQLTVTVVFSLECSRAAEKIQNVNDTIVPFSLCYGPLYANRRHADEDLPDVLPLRS